MDRRTKPSPIYDLVQTYYQPKGEVHYVAHAILADGRIIRLGEPTHTPDEGNTKVPKNHPDRIFWQRNAMAHKDVGAEVASIEIDCSLLPCEQQFNGCLYFVPAAIKDLGYPEGIPVRMYSHRDQGIAKKGESTKRVVKCAVGASRDELTKAFEAVEDWSWVG